VASPPETPHPGHPSLPPGPLPDDPENLKQIIAVLLEELEASRRRQRQLQAQIDAMARRLFGRRSEKLDPDQMELVFAELEKLGVVEVGEEEEKAEGDEPEPSSRRRRRGHGRRRLPADLPRERIELEPSPEDQICCNCHRQKERIGEEVSEQLEYVPGNWRVRQNVRGIYACRPCEENVVIAPVPPKPIAKGLPGPGLLAHVAVSKYADHLPLNRLEGIFRRQGVVIPRSTMCDWIAAAADLVQPVIEVMKQDLLLSKVIHTDDTPVPVLDRQRSSTRTGRLWVYLGDAAHPQIVFDYTANRRRAGPESFLQGFSGYLQADAYGGYDGIYAGGEVIEVACWAHVRRKFYDAQTTDASYAFTALGLIRQLYQIERLARQRELSAEELRAMRQEHSRPVLACFEKWMKEMAGIVLPKSPLAEAIGYAQRQWKALERFVEDGDLEIDNNAAERALRRVAIGRKNWLFAGSDAGGERAAALFSLVASCRLHDLDPFTYLRDLFERLPTHPTDALAELTPVAWTAARRPSALAPAA
jgi:transposase